MAYPITEKPLTIGCTMDSEGNDITISAGITGIAPQHCTIELRDGDIILTDTSAQGTFVDEKQVNGSITLKLGQTIRVGTSDEYLQLIACIE